MSSQHIHTFTNVYVYTCRIIVDFNKMIRRVSTVCLNSKSNAGARVICGPAPLFGCSVFLVLAQFVLAMLLFVLKSMFKHDRCTFMIYICSKGRVFLWTLGRAGAVPSIEMSDAEKQPMDATTIDSRPFRSCQGVVGGTLEIPDTPRYSL